MAHHDPQESAQHPKVLEGKVRPNHVQRDRDQVRQPHGPHLQPKDARRQHEPNRNQNALGRAVQVAQVQRVRMVRLPRRQKHGHAGYKRDERGFARRPHAHARRLHQAPETAVERINAMVKQLPKRRAGPCPPRLFPVNVVHGLVKEQAARKRKVQPQGAGPHEIGNVKKNARNVDVDGQNPEQSDDVWSEPERHELGSPRPVGVQHIVGEVGLVDRLAY